MKNQLSKLSKLCIIMLVFIMLVTSININVLVENIDIASLFIDSSSEYNGIYENKTLMIMSKTNDFNKYGAEVVDVQNGIYILKYKTEKDTRTAYNKYKKQNDILSVEINATMEIQEQGKEQNQANTYETEETELAKFLAQNKNSSKEVKVAILDTGINSENEIFSNRIIDLGVNLSTSGDANSIKDDNKHGTEIATIIAQNTDENVKLMPIKIANSEGKASILSTYKGIEKAIENEADIISISMNTYKTKKSEILENIINKATKQGILVIVSAGNNNMDVKNVVPSNIENAIVVSAVEENNTRAGYSNYGETIDYSSYGTYKGKKGTSYATANVTATIAKLLSQGEDASKLDEYVISLGENKYFGHGLITNNYNIIPEEISNTSDNNAITNSNNTNNIENEPTNIPNTSNENLSISATGQETFGILASGLIGRYRLNYIGNINYYAYHYQSGAGSPNVNVSGSTARLSNDGGNSIVAAYLTWTSRAPAAASTAVTIRTSEGRTQSVYPQNAYNDLRLGSVKSMFRMSANVTSFVQNSANGGYTNYTVSGIPVWQWDGANGGESLNCWQLIVIEKNDTYPVRIVQIQEGAQFIVDKPTTAMTISLPNGFTTARVGNVTGQVMFGYMTPGGSKGISASLQVGSSYVSANVGREAYLYKNGSAISANQYAGIFNLSDVSNLTKGANTVQANIYNQNGSTWCTLFNVGAAVDIDVPTFQNTQTTKAAEDKVTITGTIKNTSTNNSGVSGATAIINVDQGLRIESISGVTFNGAAVSYTKNSANQITVTIGNKWMDGGTLNYTIKAKAVVADNADGMKHTVTNSAYITGNLISNGKETTYHMDNVAYITSSTAVTPPAQIIKLTINPNGGTWNDSTETQVFSQSYNTTRTIPNPTRNGYTFTGWSIDGAGSSINNGTFRMGENNTTLTANWAINDYTLTINPNGGTWNNSSGTSTQTITYGKTATIANPTRVGYIFNSWTVSGAGSSINNGTFTMGYQNATITANWTPITYNVVYNQNNPNSNSRSNRYNAEFCIHI